MILEPVSSFGLLPTCWAIFDVLGHCGLPLSSAQKDSCYMPERVCDLAVPHAHMQAQPVVDLAPITSVAVTNLWCEPWLHELAVGKLLHPQIHLPQAFN